MTGNIEIVIIIGVVILLFGASAIPKIARSIGKARREFRKGLEEEQEERDQGEKGDNNE